MYMWGLKLASGTHIGTRSRFLACFPTPSVQLAIAQYTEIVI